MKKTVLTKNTTTKNRGMNLEEAINQTNQYYIDHDIAFIYKKPIPIQVVKVDYERRSAAKISEAYYKVPSTTDYNGIYKGKYLDFEAKETISKTSFPLKNIHLHQINHLENIVRHGGIGFVIIYFSKLGETYLIDQAFISKKYHEKESGPKSIPYEDIRLHGHLLKEGYACRLDYLQVVDETYFNI